MTTELRTANDTIGEWRLMADGVVRTGLARMPWLTQSPIERADEAMAAAELRRGARR